MKKVMFITDMPRDGAREHVAKLCGLSVEKFDVMFDFGVLFTREIPWDLKDAIFKVGHTLKQSPHPILVLVGHNVGQAFGVEGQPLFETFMFGEGGTEEEPEQVRMILKIPSSDQDRFFRKETNRRMAMAVLGNLVMMCRQPVSQKDARVCCQAVRNLGDDNISLWTRKHLEDIESRLLIDDVIDHYDLSDLMKLYANDVQFMTKRQAQ